MKNYYTFLRPFFDIILNFETEHFLNYICVYNVRHIHIAYVKAQCFSMPFMY